MALNRLFLSPPHMGSDELEFVKEAFDSNYIAPLGPMVDAFEREFAEYTDIKYCVALSSGTAAMHLALRVLGSGFRVQGSGFGVQGSRFRVQGSGFGVQGSRFGVKGSRFGVQGSGFGVQGCGGWRTEDEVFASTLTFIGSVTPVMFLGASPVFIDCDRETWNMDPVLLERELERCAEKGKLPKAVVPTDLYGQCCDYGRIFEVCERYDVPVIVDAAEAMGSRYQLPDVSSQISGDKTQSSGTSPTSDLGHPTSDPWKHAGAGAKAAVFSFNGNKIMTTSGGGMLASDDGELIEHARFLSQQAREPFVHYEHEEIGYNYRMSNVLAAIGRGQLRVLDERVRRKREIFDYYYGALADVPGIEFMPEADYGRCNRWLTVILITPEMFGADREAVRLALEKGNIESRPVWKPMHMQPVFNPQITQIDADFDGKKRYPCRVVGGEVSEDLFARGLCLPSGTAMTNGDLDRVIDIILKCQRK